MQRQLIIKMHCDDDNAAPQPDYALVTVTLDYARRVLRLMDRAKALQAEERALTLDIVASDYYPHYVASDDNNIFAERTDEREAQIEANFERIRSLYEDHESVGTTSSRHTPPVGYVLVPVGEEVECTEDFLDGIQLGSDSSRAEIDYESLRYLVYPKNQSAYSYSELLERALFERLLSELEQQEVTA